MALEHRWLQLFTAAILRKRLKPEPSVVRPDRRLPSKRRADRLPGSAHRTPYPKGRFCRLSSRLGDAERDLAPNKKMLCELVKILASGLLSRLGIGPVSAAQAIVT